MDQQTDSAHRQQCKHARFSLQSNRKLVNFSVCSDIVRTEFREGRPLRHAFQADFAGDATITVKDTFGSERALTGSKTRYPPSLQLHWLSPETLRGIEGESSGVSPADQEAGRTHSACLDPALIRRIMISCDSGRSSS